MSYAKETCAECKLPMVASNGVMPKHFIRGTKVPCDGSGEMSLEAEDSVIGDEESDEEESAQEGEHCACAAHRFRASKGGESIELHLKQFFPRLRDACTDEGESPLDLRNACCAWRDLTEIEDGGQP